MNVSTDTTRPTDVYKKLNELYAARSTSYGDSYKMVGKIMKILFPDFQARTLIDHVRLHLVGWMVGKLCRYAASIQRGGAGHEDSLQDLAAYAVLLYCEEQNSQDVQNL